MSGDQHSIFIGYRRDDTADAAGRVYDRLRNEFGAEAVFKDVDRLPPGVDFGDFILTVLPKCRVFLAMIGPGWLEASDEAGDRRLDDPEDWVRIELETALETPGLQVVPVLINGAPMPRADDLPDCLRVLPRLNAAFVRRDPDFHRDMDKLIGALKDGLQSGRAVEVEQNAAPVLATGSSAAWKLIEGSL
ncbi:MAG: toll/interleukin-1 receptor domain-containing protein, partial [Pseudomonadota bacterium]